MRRSPVSQREIARAYEAELVHGLLQTPDYYRAYRQTAPARGTDEEIERMIALRKARQERLTGENPATYWVIMNEAVIRRIVGGVKKYGYDL
jgi:hypothetical protein